MKKIGDLVESTQVIVSELSLILKDIDSMLANMGEGDFMVDSQAADRYIGNFEPLLISAQAEGKTQRCVAPDPRECRTDRGWCRAGL